MAPSHAKAGDDVQYVDVVVSIKDEEFIIDFLITAPRDTNAKEASQQVGFVAQAGQNTQA